METKDKKEMVMKSGEEEEGHAVLNSDNIFGSTPSSPTATIQNPNYKFTSFDNPYIIPVGLYFQNPNFFTSFIIFSYKVVFGGFRKKNMGWWAWSKAGRLCQPGRVMTRWRILLQSNNSLLRLRRNVTIDTLFVRFNKWKRTSSCRFILQVTNFKKNYNDVIWNTDVYYLLIGVCCRLFNENPHPGDRQRLRLSEELGLTPLQVKFWFQNKRTQIKVKITL